MKEIKYVNKIKKIKYVGEFREFLKEYKIVSVGIAFVMGLAVNDLVRSFVNNMLMPLINPLVHGNWEAAVLKIGSIEISWGSFLSSLIYFLILATVVFIVVKKLMKEDREKK